MFFINTLQIFLTTPSLYLILTERREYQKIVYYINKKPGSILNNS